jgi:GTP-binding protein
MLDRVELHVKAGNGGNGAVTFRREKFVPFGGPSGGDGGKGGDVVVQSDASVSTFRAFQHRRTFRAEEGQQGMSKKKHGKDGADLVLKVPPGTLIYYKAGSGEDLIADLESDGQAEVVARGGRGGWGNSHFATPTNQAPRVAQPGVSGQERTIVIELRLIADAGIIGFPNVGKSSLLAAVSAANPKIADYPFTTVEPILGQVEVGNHTFVLAEIPGLIEGAHAGKGLGHEFLRHAMRTRVLVHVIDGSSATPVEDMINVNNELAMWDASLAKRPQVVVVNKTDLPDVKARLAKIKEAFREADIDPIFISAVTGSGLKELINETWKLLKVSDIRAGVAVPAPPKVFRPQSVEGSAGIQKSGGTFIVADPELEHLLDRIDLSRPEEQEEFKKSLEKLGINKLLKSAGAKSGDRILSGKKEWQWYYTDEHRRSGRNV